MSEMVERVARALFLAEHPTAEWSAGRARMKWFALAEAAIAEMREPTEAMIEAADNRWISCGDLWVKMIDAALSQSVK